MTRTDEQIQIQVEVCVEPHGEGFHAYCPAFKGLHVGGDTEREAIANAQDAIMCYLVSYLKHGDPLPSGMFVPKMVGKRTSSCVPAQARSHLVQFAIAPA